jgi:alpha-tubulin suppressor-like RCC1 family protein
VVVGNKHGLGIDMDNNLYGWGSNLYGELLISEKVRINEPIKLSDNKVIRIAVHNSVSYFIGD